MQFAAVKSWPSVFGAGTLSITFSAMLQTTASVLYMDANDYLTVHVREVLR
jgi:hypothetical protein